MCGIFGIYSPFGDASKLTFIALHALQSRGQEGSGIISYSSKYNEFCSEKGSGLVSQVFNEKIIKKLKGDYAIGHNRYSTAGGTNNNNIQPFCIETSIGFISVAHNGQLIKHKTIRKDIIENGVGLFTQSDTEVITQIIASNKGTLIERLQSLIMKTDGAYSLVILTKNGLYALRDPCGYRPLIIGYKHIEETNQYIYAISSESCALETLSMTTIRDVGPGEIIKVTNEGFQTEIIYNPRNIPENICVFEYIYFARPDSIINKKQVHKIRMKMGAKLAEESPVPNGDIVIGVPDSSIAAAMGFAAKSNILFSDGLIKNRYINRTFIKPNQKQRLNSISLKYNVLSQNIKDKNIVLVDDSIVRGNTMKYLIQLLKTASPKSIHVRVASPPIISECFMGIDIPTKEELIANNKSILEIQKYIQVDSLKYLSHESMVSVFKGMGICTGCFTGKYPTDIEDLY